MPHVNCVLDVGCASGRFTELLTTYNSDFSYTGIDISKESIERAKSNYKDCKFCCTNALEYKTKSKFDLVNATGVLQHEPSFEQLIKLMVNWARRYVLFDVKISNIPNKFFDLSSIPNKYYDADLSQEDPLPPLKYYILSLKHLQQLLFNLPKVKLISIYGYETKVHSMFEVPSKLQPIVSAGVLLTLGDASEISAPKFDIKLPESVTNIQLESSPK
jgi:SAM-dependent methyltransferase